MESQSWFQNQRVFRTLHLSSINGFGMTAVTRKGIQGNTVSASTPTYVVGSAFTAMVSLTADF